MGRNVTLCLDEAILRMARTEAVSKDLSLSQWVSDLIAKFVKKESAFDLAKKRAVKRLGKGFHLGGQPLARGNIYE